MNTLEEKQPTACQPVPADCQLARLVHVIATQYDGDTVAYFNAVLTTPILQKKELETEAVSLYLKNSE